MEETPEEKKKRQQREASARYRARHPDRIKASAKKYHEEHKEEDRARNKKYYEEHKEERNKYSRDLYQEHRNEVLEHVKIKRKKEPEKSKKSWQRFYERHKDKIKKKRATPRGRYNVYKTGAKARKIPWLLSREQAYELFTGKCHYCGHDPEPTHGIDRTNNSGAYVMGNVVTSCSECNYMKNEMDMEVFVARCGVIWNNLGEKMFGNK